MPHTRYDGPGEFILKGGPEDGQVVPKNLFGRDLEQIGPGAFLLSVRLLTGDMYMGCLNAKEACWLGGPKHGPDTIKLSCGCGNCSVRCRE